VIATATQKHFAKTEAPFMSRHRRALRPFLAALIVALAWPPAQSQEAQPGTGDIVARIDGEFFRRPYLTILAADPSGQVRFEIPPEHRISPSILERVFVLGDGHALMIVRPPNPEPDEVRLYRVAIREITAVQAPDRSFTAALTPTVAAQLHRGDSAMLVRPACTTRQLRELPDAIPIASPEPRTPDADREDAARTKSIVNLKRIGMALLGFVSTYEGRLPPAVIAGPDGRPWHSWRVLVLPFLDEVNLYDRYHFDEPWDGPNNRQLLDSMPEVFSDPIHGDDRGHFTHYAALVGAATAFPPAGAILGDAKRPVRLPIGPGSGGSIGLRDITDGTSRTLLVAPVAPDRKIPWTKPEDIAVGADFPGLGHPAGIAAPYRARRGPAGHHVAPVLFADGSVRSLLDTIDPKVMAALLTRAGREIVSEDQRAGDAGPLQRAAYVTVRIRRDGERFRATIEPTETGG
jgi:hypothetical protein